MTQDLNRTHVYQKLFVSQIFILSQSNGLCTLHGNGTGTETRTGMGIQFSVPVPSLCSVLYIETHRPNPCSVNEPFEFFHNSRLIRRIEQKEFPKKIQIEARLLAQQSTVIALIAQQSSTLAITLECFPCLCEAVIECYPCMGDSGQFI